MSLLNVAINVEACFVTTGVVLPMALPLYNDNMVEFDYTP